ncbi:MAG: 30S ribosomal protein S19e [Candidatus Aenigmarchaeota archaeon]|nr:30S ribosomal protein S19e [Candidatus Aenigmarchaeota archaeon]
MVSVNDVPADKFIGKLKEELKAVAEVNPPSWAKFVKSGVHKQRPPEQEDFWHLRSASVLRRLYLDGPIGVEQLRTYFGGRKQFGHAPAHFRKASGNIIRKILMQLEKAGLVEKSQDKKGRLLSSKGRKFLNVIAYRVSKE